MQRKHRRLRRRWPAILKRRNVVQCYSVCLSLLVLSERIFWHCTIHAYHLPGHINLTQFDCDWYYISWVFNATNFKICYNISCLMLRIVKFVCLFYWMLTVSGGADVAVVVTIEISWNKCCWSVIMLCTFTCFAHVQKNINSMICSWNSVFSCFVIVCKVELLSIS